MVIFLFTKKKINSIISKSIEQTFKDKELFDKNFTDVSDRIVAAKAEMKERSSKRNLIRY